MATEVRLTRAMNANSALVRDLVQQGANAIQREMRNIETDVEREVSAIIAAEFHAREGMRHKEGDAHLDARVRAEVTSPNGSFPIIISVTSLSNDQRKIGALEFGSPPHKITAHGDGFLYFPSNRVGRSKKGAMRGVFGTSLGAVGVAKNLAAFETKGRGTGSRGGSVKSVAKLKSVQHPGNRAHHFLQKGLERAVRKALARGR